MNAADIIGYTYQGAAYCVDHAGTAVEALIAQGEASPAARDLPIAYVLRQLDAANAGELELPAPVFADAEGMDLVCDVPHDAGTHETLGDSYRAGIL